MLLAHPQDQRSNQTEKAGDAQRSYWTAKYVRFSLPWFDSEPKMIPKLKAKLRFCERGEGREQIEANAQLGSLLRQSRQDEQKCVIWENMVWDMQKATSWGGKLAVQRESFVTVRASDDPRPVPSCFATNHYEIFISHNSASSQD